MSRRVTVVALLSLIAAIGLLFFQVIRPFVVAIFVSIVLAVLFTPLHRWLTDRLNGHNRIAAAFTTTCVVLLVLLPIGFTLLMAGTQVMEAGKEVVTWFEDSSSDDLDRTLEEIQQTRIGSAMQRSLSVIAGRTTRQCKTVGRTPSRRHNIDSVSTNTGHGGKPSHLFR